MTILRNPFPELPLEGPPMGREGRIWTSACNIAPVEEFKPDPIHQALTLRGKADRERAALRVLGLLAWPDGTLRAGDIQERAMARKELMP